MEPNGGIFQPAIDTIENFVTGVIANLPNILAALFVFVIGTGIARTLERASHRALVRMGRPTHTATMLSRLVRYVAILAAFFLALTILLPSLTPESVLAGLGFGSVAVGFAFRDILQNFLAGILILLTEPFRLGDQIMVAGFEGTVEDIEIRATMLRTYDNRRVVIPNADIYTKEVVVNTAYPQRRSQYEVGIGYGDDIAASKAAVLAAIRQVPGVSAQPEPDVVLVDLAPSAVMMRVRWWTASRQADATTVHDRVIERIKSSLDLKGATPLVPPPHVADPATSRPPSSTDPDRGTPPSETGA